MAVEKAGDPLWRVKAFNYLTRRWHVFASGSEEFCTRIALVEGMNPSRPYSQFKLERPRASKAGRGR